MSNVRRLVGNPGPGLVVLYRWRLHPGAEASFTEAWSRITASLRAQAGSLGSRLHRGSDGLWYGYAQWPDALTRQRAFAGALDPATIEQMRAAVAEALPEVLLESVADFLVLPHEAHQW
jgi:hypothetical protein